MGSTEPGRSPLPMHPSSPTKLTNFLKPVNFVLHHVRSDNVAWGGLRQDTEGLNQVFLNS